VQHTSAEERGARAGLRLLAGYKARSSRRQPQQGGSADKGRLPLDAVLSGNAAGLCRVPAKPRTAELQHSDRTPSKAKAGRARDSSED